MLEKNRHQNINTNIIYRDVHQMDAKTDAATALHFGRLMKKRGLINDEKNNQDNNLDQTLMANPQNKSNYASSSSSSSSSDE